jgi:predicted DNA-binding protein
MRDTVRLNFEFPREEYPYLKMMCAEKGMSLRELATELLQGAIEEYEDLRLGKKARKRLREANPKDVISFDEAAKEAGWCDA